MKIAVMLAISFPHVWGADDQVASFASNGYVREAWITSEEAFTTQALQERAKAFLRRHEAAVFGLLEISIGPGVRFYGHKGTNHISVTNYFHRLHEVYADGVQAYGDIASLLKIGRAAVLRIRKGGRVVSINVGDARTSMPGAAEGFEILHFGPLFNRRVVEGIELFVRTTRPVTKEELRKLAMELRLLRPQLQIRIIARMDAWFITEPGFPFLYPFDDPVVIPTPEGYRKSWPGEMVAEPDD